ncbi:MAG: D-2-hydroxyacid dehydrogenase [Prosthecobacter sp.]|nr:D-2-hydroxyacid dehydrogenase [Prosthecobacter sp.]
MNIFIDTPIYEPGLARLKALHGVNESIADHIADERVVRPADQLRDVDALFCADVPENLSDMKALTWVQITSSGFEHLIPLDLPARGIRASNARGVFDAPIAEWCFAMMVNLARDLPQMYRNQQAGHWDRGAAFQSEIRGRTAGFWGYGGLARETARLAKCAGLRVHVLARNGVGPQQDLYRVPGTGDPDGVLPDEVFGTERKDAFLSGLDFLIIALPLNDSTRGLVTAEDLRKLPERALLLNPARGPIIQEEALLQALNEDWIAGAALDTHYHYPMPPDHPLWRMPNVIMTPHISGSTKSTCFPERVWDLFVQNVERMLRGDAPLNELPAEALTPKSTM